MSTLTGAQNVVINNSQLINYISDVPQGVGLEKLRQATIRGASHDSSERYPPPICHPGTRNGYIGRLTEWGFNANNHVDRIAWVKGPAGVGKSAIAQSCAEALGDKLGASFFFSRPNHRDDPDRFFTSLAYQLAVKHNSFGTHLDREISRNPTLVDKSLPNQFYYLLVAPFSHSVIKEEVGEQVIIVDGLDECSRKEAQVDIIKTVAESARAGTTPFLWIFLSRLEPEIVTVFDRPEINTVSQQIDLPISREIDKEILLYLTDKLLEIGRKHPLLLPWPSEEEIWALVDFSAGLFACAHAIILFIGTDDPAGPVEQLYVVLQLATRSATKSRKHPLSALDELYTLVMERVPPAMLQIVQWILLTTRVAGVNDIYGSVNLSGLSELRLRNACRCLHSVMTLDGGEKPRVVFYHASFMDYLEDPARSGRFCIWSDFAITLLEEILRHLDRVQVDIDPRGRYRPQFDLPWPQNQSSYYHLHVRAFFQILYSIRLSDTGQGLPALVNFDFKKISFVGLREEVRLRTAGVDVLSQNLGLQLKLLRPCHFRNWRASVIEKSTARYYTIGRGKKRAVLRIQVDSPIVVKPYSPRVFKKWAKQVYEVHHTN